MAGTDTDERGPEVGLQPRPTPAPMSVDGIPSPSMRQPRAAVNNSVLEAVIGLTNLGGTPTSPSASKISRSPSMGSEEEVVHQSRAAPNDAARVSRPFDAKARACSANRTMIAPASTLSKSKALKPEIAEIIATKAASRPEASAMMLPALTQSPHPYLTNAPLSYSDRLTSKMAARRSNLDQPPWSSQMFPFPLPRSFDAQRPPLHFHSADASLSTAAGLHPSASERLAALDRIATFRARLSDPPYAPLPLPTQRRTAPALSNKNFPETLYAVLSSQEHAHIIAWLPHGRGFIIHDKKRFGDEILPQYFDGAKFTSFTRRLKRWNFERVPRGPELGAYYNKYIIRGRLDLVQKMRYRAGGQFDEGKKKGKESGGESEEDESPKERTDDEVESMGRGKSINEESRARARASLPEPMQEDLKNQIIADKKAIDVTNPQDLPLTLPERTKAIKEAIARPSSGASGMLRNVPSIANAKPSSFPRGHPNPARLNTSDQQLLTELQRELVLVHAISKSIANEGLLGHAGASLRSAAASCLSRHLSAAERMFSAEYVKRALETEQVLELAALRRRHTANIHNINQEAMASNFLGPSKTEEAMTTPMHEMRSRMGLPLSEHALPRSNSHVGYGSSAHLQGPIGCIPFAKISRSEGQREGAHHGNGRRPVVISKEEEEEFSKYLALKRSAF